MHLTAGLKHRLQGLGPQGVKSGTSRPPDLVLLQVTAERVHENVSDEEARLQETVSALATSLAHQRLAAAREKYLAASPTRAQSPQPPPPPRVCPSVGRLTPSLTLYSKV